MVSNIFYPFDKSGESKIRFKELIEDSFKDYQINNIISEENFCLAMVDKFYL